MNHILRILSQCVYSKQKTSRLHLIEYDTTEHRILSISPFIAETENTIFFNGTIAIVNASCPEDADLTIALDYLAYPEDSPVYIMFFTNTGTEMNITSSLSHQLQSATRAATQTSQTDCNVQDYEEGQ